MQASMASTLVKKLEESVSEVFTSASYAINANSFVLPSLFLAMGLLSLFLLRTVADRKQRSNQCAGPGLRDSAHDFYSTFGGYEDPKPDLVLQRALKVDNIEGGVAASELAIFKLNVERRLAELGIEGAEVRCSTLLFACMPALTRPPLVRSASSQRSRAARYTAFRSSCRLVPAPSSAP